MEIELRRTKNLFGESVWRSDEYREDLCSKGMSNLFAIPSAVKRIWLVLSKRETPCSYQVRRLDLRMFTYDAMCHNEVISFIPDVIWKKFGDEFYVECEYE